MWNDLAVVLTCTYFAFNSAPGRASAAEGSVNGRWQIQHPSVGPEPRVRLHADRQLNETRSLLPSDQLESSSLRSPGTLRPRMRKSAMRNLPQLSQSRVVMIAIMMMIEMMNQRASRAQATARSLAHLLFLAIRAPARAVPSPSDAVVSFFCPPSQIHFLRVTFGNCEPELLEGCRQGKPDYVVKIDLAGLCL